MSIHVPGVTPPKKTEPKAEDEPKPKKSEDKPKK